MTVKSNRWMPFQINTIAAARQMETYPLWKYVLIDRIVT